MGWIKSSTHNNEEYAQVNADVLAQGGHPARVLRQGKIIYEAKNATKH